MKFKEKNYVSPSVKVVMVKVEKGFQGSGQGQTVFDQDKIPGFGGNFTPDFPGGF